jgi:amino acid adenylation domain-containing protein
MAKIWQELLGVEAIGITDNFFELGGHSLIAMRVISRLRSTMGVDLPLRALFGGPTIRELALEADRLQALRRPPAPRQADSERGSAALSRAQEGLWFIDRLFGPSNLYNIAHARRLRGPVDVALLHQAVQALVNRHASLRTAIQDHDGTPIQLLTKEIAVPLPVVQVPGETSALRERALIEELRTEAARPFDLCTAPLFRARLLRLHEDEHVLQVVMHHIIADGWSIGVMERDLSAFYAHYAGIGGGKQELPQALPIQFSDYVRWQGERLVAGRLEELLGFWRKRLAGAEPLALPTDHARPVEQSFRGSTHRFTVGRGTLGRLNELGRQEDATLFMVLLAAFKVLLARYSGQTDIIIGSPVAGRELPEAEGLIGYFVNTLVMRTDLSGDPSFSDVVLRVRDSALDAYAHQELPFDDLVANLSPERDLGRNPLYQVSFALNNQPGSDLLLPAVEVLDQDVPVEKSHFDLSLSLVELEGQLEGTLEFSTDLFEDATIHRMAGHFQSLLNAAVEHPAGRISSLPLLGEAERRLVLESWNQTDAPIAQDILLPQLIERQAGLSPDKVAAVFGKTLITYDTLNKRANQLAHHLRALGVVPDVLVAVCLPRGIDMIVAMLATLKAGGAYLPLDPDHPRERLGFMLDDASVSVVLTDSATRASLFDGSVAAGRVLLCLDADADAVTPWPDVDPEPVARPSDLAYVIYTSGSTGVPKGVMIEHRSLVNNIAWQIREFSINASDRYLQRTTIVFDASVWDLWTPLSVGATQIVADEMQLRDPSATLDLIIKEAITVVQCVPGFFSALLDEAEARAFPDSLRLMVVGGEALASRDARRWLAGTRAELVNSYGPTECTVDATFLRCRADNDERKIVPIGRPMANTRIYILDAHLQPVPIGVAGEICIAGAGVARGYLNRDDLTAERFPPDPFGKVPGARMYRSGDVGRFLPDGAVEFLGRKDHQVKIRGYRVELEEIACALRLDPAVEQAAVLVVETLDAPARLAGFVVPETIDTGLLRESLKARLPGYMVPSSLTAMPSLPTLQNGKLDRAALAELQPDQRLEHSYEAPQGTVEVTLAGIWSRILRLPQVGRRDNFFELGGHSLMVVSMVQAAMREGIATSVRAVFGKPTLAELAASISIGDSGKGFANETASPPVRIPDGCSGIAPAMLTLVDLDQTDIDRIAKAIPGGACNIQDIYPLAPLQEGILYHHQIETEGDTYLLRNIIAFDSRQRLQDFLSALQVVIDRHDSLRTAILWENLPQPVQVVQRNAALPVHTVACPAGGNPVEALKEATDPARLRLDIRRAPLMCAYVADDPASDTCYLSLIDHHLIGDHVSLDLMFDEIRLLMQGGSRLLNDPVPYREFVSHVRSAQWSQHESYFRDMLGDVGEGTVPFEITAAGGELPPVGEACLELSQEQSSRIYAMAQRHGTSAAVLFHLAWAMVLARCSNQTDVVFGTVLIGRSHGFRGIDRVFGLCMNTLPVRLKLDNITVKDAVAGTFRQLGELMEHDHAPLSLAQRCSSVPAPAPLFTALLNYRHSSAIPVIGSATAPGTLAGAWNVLSEERTNYPFNAFVDDLGKAFRLTAQCSAPADPRRVLGYLLHAVLSLSDALETRPRAPISSLNLLPADEQDRLIGEWNDTSRKYPSDTCIHHLIEAQVGRQPDSVAVLFKQQKLTYGEMDQRANQLARLLRSRGCSKGRLVGLCVERSTAMLIAQLAVLKAGAAYVPLDPAYPSDRLQFMATDAGLEILITESALAGALQWPAEKTVLLDGDAHLIEAQSDEPVALDAQSAGPHDLAYVIYTSGSTGKPKGVMVEHRSVVNFLCSMACEPGVGSSDRVLAITTLSFDIAVLELLLPLSVGAQVVLASREEATDGMSLLSLLKASRATVMQATPASWRMLLEAGWEGSLSLKALVGGEALAADLAAQLLPRTESLWNMYGPTETTVWSTCAKVDDLESGITIGRPIANTRILVLDQRGDLCPTGIAGEICIGGDGVARGYLHRPDLSSERFVADRFSGRSGERLYRTGDRGRWREDGSLEHLGRLDFQVKVRGYRIEPGEIETVLGTHPDVRRCLVIAREDRPGDVRLVAYVVPRNAMPVTALLREHLRATLPDYMVPQHFLSIPDVPLLPNGTVNRAALPRPGEGTEEPRHVHDAAGLSTPSEHLIARVWSELLGVEQITADDNFFSLGGHSLLAMQAITRIEKLSGRRLDQRRVVLESLGQLAAAIDAPASTPARQSAGILRRLLGRLGK